MNIRNLKILFFTGLALMFTGYGCTEKIDIQLDDTYTRLVVYGAVTTDTMAHMVELTTTSSYYYDQTPPPVQGATVEISDDEGDLITLTEKEPGKYYTPDDFYGVAGRTYDLRIELVQPVNNNRIYTASSFLPAINQVDSIRLMSHPDWGDNGFVEVQCYYQDPPTKEYYMFNIFKNDLWLTDTITTRIISDDEFYNGSYTNGIGVGFLNQGKAREKVNEGDTITFQGCSITKDYYEFIRTLQEESSGFSNPLFSGPPANVKGNISNGAIGFFAAYAVSYASTVYKP